MTTSVLGRGHSGRTAAAVLDLDLDVVEAGRARARVRELLGQLPAVALADAIQVFDELVSNACRHGLAPRRCRVSLREHARVRIEVDDTGPDTPHLRTPDGTGGRGLILVDALATAWACNRHHDRKTVWAELVLARSSLRPA
ncbi:ATP-binding protein [Nocardia inohanensis]|uniref:ATP-binding protein n=1 Tax=Nocardia inohanensis TaxID=209246 RepID=UPI00083502CD|nr:ATP-binding protein [Nocardia inohanensis]